MLRGLSEGDFFRRSTHHWREEGTGRRRQRSTFNLNRDNELVGRMLTARLGPAAPVPIAAEGNGATPAEPVADARRRRRHSGRAAARRRTTGAGGQRTSLQRPRSKPRLPSNRRPPPVEDELDDVYDEPQPRNVRRRPFTSRLLRS